MWLGYSCSLLFVISYHWHPPLHIHIYTCQIWHLYPQEIDQVLGPFLEYLTFLSPSFSFLCIVLFCLFFSRNDTTFLKCKKTPTLVFSSKTGGVFAFVLRVSLPCFPVWEGDQTVDHFHAMWESLLFQWLPGRQPFPSLFGAFGSITTGAHLMWSPPSD